jgi:hypothetical protein
MRKWTSAAQEDRLRVDRCPGGDSPKDRTNSELCSITT